MTYVGAGNLLSAQQHGYDYVGFDMYHRCVSRAVARNKEKNLKTKNERVYEMDLGH